MTHEEIKVLISAYIDGEVTPTEKNIIEEHLSTCASCQKDLKMYKAMSSSLSKWPDETLSPDEAMKVQKHLEQRREPMFTQRNAAILVSTVCLVLFIGTFLQIKHLRHVSSASMLGEQYVSLNSPQPAVQRPITAVAPQMAQLPLSQPIVQKPVMPVTLPMHQVMGMQLAFNKGIEGRLKSAADDIGDQYSTAVRTRPMQLASAQGGASYEPYYMASNYSVENKRLSSGLVGMDSNTYRVRSGIQESVYSGYDSNTYYYPNTWYYPEPAPIEPYRIQDAESNTEQYDHFEENTFLGVKENPLSTFSIDVDTASYSNIRRFLMSDQMPPKDAVHIEEMINYFHYNYPQPAWNVPFSITTEMVPCPWNRSHNLALVGLQGKKIALANLPPSNLVFLVDVSGSMGEEDKLPLVKAALHLLVEQLRPQDTVSIAAFAGSASSLLEPTSGRDKDKIEAAIDGLEAGGSTNGDEGLQLAYKIAKENFLPKGNNRIIVTTDGDFNVGTTNDGDLIQMIEQKRDEGTYLTVLGFGMGNIKASRMEKLADSGNGNFAYIDTLDEARKVLVEQLGGTLYTIAKDVKVQVEFNPAQVKAYRLVGYEKRILKKEDFNNDKKEAGELGDGRTVTALYEIVPAGSAENFDNVDALKYQTSTESTSTVSDEVMTVKLRYKNLHSKDDKSKLIVKTIKKDQLTAPGSENIRFAAAVAEFGMLLRHSEYKGNASYLKIINEAQLATGEDPDGLRAEFFDLVQRAGLLDRPVKPAPVQKVVTYQSVNNSTTVPVCNPNMQEGLGCTGQVVGGQVEASSAMECAAYCSRWPTASCAQWYGTSLCNCSNGSVTSNPQAYQFASSCR